jgi:copper resistance protein C
MRRFAVVVALVGAGLVGLAGTASAHNSLIDSNPKNEATTDTGPAEVSLTFDLPVRAGEGLNSIAVTGPDGKSRWEAGPATVDSTVVTAPVRELGPKGVYTIGYRVMSADGHPVTGKLTFTLTRAGNGTPAKAAEESAGGGGGIPLWVWLAGAGVLLVAGLVFAMRVGGGDKQNA